MILAGTVAVLVTGGVYLLLQRSMVRAVFGIGLLSHAANFVLLTSGGTNRRGQPLSDRTGVAEMADPLPQAMVLTAIVITMAVAAFVLTLAYRSFQLH
ncbi:MAG: NADH-quinone oxidoreductase subunit K, partial [Austwickia sp.]|nr:NADH-quinone oxidoreductase subunit K [Austwickia sp.]